MRRRSSADAGHHTHAPFINFTNGSSLRIAPSASAQFCAARHDVPRTAGNQMFRMSKFSTIDELIDPQWTSGATNGN